MFSHLANDAGLIASFVAAGIGTLGLLSMAALGDWGRRNSPYFSAFAVGILIAAVLFHLIPEALAYSIDAWKWVVSGFAFFTLLAAMLSVLMRRSGENPSPVLSYASTMAVAAHSFTDGFIYEAAFHNFDQNHITLFTGVLTTFGLMLHKFPVGIIAFGLLRQSGMNRLRAGLVAFVVVGLTTPLGAIGGYLIFEQLRLVDISLVMGLTAGALIYLIVFHLGPDAALAPDKRGYGFAMLGVGVGILAVVLHAMGGVG